MKGLLHSKRFRTNLYKWLFMYLGVMAVLITVITYSRYITSMGVDDNARVAKFNVDLSYDNCEPNSDSICELGSYRPTSKIKYNFNVKKDMEVKTDFVLNIYVNNDFNILSLMSSDWTENLKPEEIEVLNNINYNEGTFSKDLSTGEKLTIKTSSISNSENSEDIEENKIKIITISSTLPANYSDITKYTIQLKYAGEDQSYSEAIGYDNVLTVGYSAEQINK